MRPPTPAIAAAPAIAVAFAVIASLTAPARGDDQPSTRAPVVTRFAPTSGPPGTRVTMTGVGLGADVRIAYGARPLPIVGRPAPDAVTLVIPADAAESAPFIVTNRAGATQSGAWFVLELPATVTSMTPTSGPPGTAITLSGDGFHGDERVSAGNKELRVIERQPRGVVVAAPRGPGGPLTLFSAGRSITLPYHFDVSVALAIQSFTPTEGPPGTLVTLRGSGLGSADRITYGGLPCPILKSGPAQIVVQIAPGAAGQDVFFVEAADQRTSSADVYRVTPAGAPARAKIGAFSPRGGTPGIRVTLRAEGLGTDVEIWFGDARCPVVRRDAQRIVFAIPDGAAGRGPFILVDADGRRSTTAEFFEVLERVERPRGH